MLVEIYDIQCYNQCFIYTGYSIQDEKLSQFVINKDQNDLVKLYNHLFDNKDFLQVGFNCIDNHYLSLHYLIENYEALKTLSGNLLADNLYRGYNSILNDDKKKKDVVYGKKHIDQIDLYKIWYFVGKDKEYTLEDLKFSMKFHDMSYPRFDKTSEITNEKLDQLLLYSRNNVEILYQLTNVTLGDIDDPLYKGENKLAIRDFLSEKYKLDCTNLNDVEIVERIILYECCRKLKKSKEDFNNAKTYPSEIRLIHCVPDFAENIQSNLKNGINKLKEIIVTPDQKAEFSHVEKFHGLDIQFNLKGLSACVDSGEYKTIPGGNIVLIDVKSMFPSIANKFNLYPKQIGPVFNEIYDELTTLRIKSISGKEKNSALSKCLKRGLNAIWGKFGKKDYFLYDPIVKYSVSIYGQAFMCLLLERLQEVKDIEFLMVNTDSVMVRVTGGFSAIQRICEQATFQTGIEFSISNYDVITILSKDDYLLEDIFDCYGKGVFDLNPGYSKSTSSMIIPIALKEYFRYGKSLKETINNHNDIYDFCVKMKDPGRTIRGYHCENQYGIQYCDKTTDDLPVPDYGWYIKKASLIVSKITQKQQKLF